MKLTGEMKQKIDDYFDNVTDEQLLKDLEEATPKGNDSGIIGVGLHTLKMWHDLSFNNKVKIQLMDQDWNVSCFYCCKVFPAKEIIEYTNPRGRDTGTALCPYCSIDSVTLMELGEQDLSLMSDYYFGDNETNENQTD